MKKTYIDTAMERIAPDLILKGGNVVDVFSGRVIKADVIIKDGIICGVGSYSGETNKTFRQIYYAGFYRFARSY